MILNFPEFCFLLYSFFPSLLLLLLLRFRYINYVSQRLKTKPDSNTGACVHSSDRYDLDNMTETSVKNIHLFTY